MRLIDADALKKLRHDYIQGRIKFNGSEYDLIDKCPTIDPESLRPLGVWVGEADGYADGDLVYDVWYCSDCNYCIDDGTDDPDLLPNYCPNCGAKMKGEDLRT